VVVYFTVRSSTAGSVFKINQGGEISKAIGNVQASQLLVTDDYIFIIDHEVNSPDPSTSIYRFNPDGSESKIICKDEQQRFVVYSDGEWIYYYVFELIFCQTDEPELGEEPRMYDYATLYKMKSDGSSKQKVLSYLYVNNPLYISDGWIYYSCDPPDWAIEQEKLSGTKRGLYKIKLDGTEKTKLLDNPPPISGVVKEGDWLFYSGDGLFRLKIDGSENIKLCDDGVASVNVKNQWVYFTTFDEQISLYRIDWQENNRQTLSQQERVQDISISGDCLYFHVCENAGMHLYRIKPDGTGEERLK